MNEPRERATVLLADDDDDDCFLFGEAFEKAGVDCRLERVFDGQELLDRLRRGPAPAAILLDLNMPRKNGHQALAELKSDAALSRIPVVVITASRSEEDARRARELGADLFLFKPNHFVELVALAQSVARLCLRDTPTP